MPSVCASLQTACASTVGSNRQRLWPANQPAYFDLTMSINCRTSRQRQSNLRVVGLQRPVFVLFMMAAALYLWWRNRAWLNLFMALIAGDVCWTTQTR